MSKDRQQQRNTHVPTAGSRTATMELREQPQASVTKDGDFIVVTAPPTATGKDVEAAVAEFERAAGEVAERAPDRTPAELIERADRPRRGFGETDGAFLARLRSMGGAEAEASELRDMLETAREKAEFDRERIQQLEDTRRAALDELAEALKNGGTTSLTEEVRIAREQQREQSKPPANIPKAVHHLRKAANALPMVRDPIGEAMQKVAVALLEDPTITCHDNARRILPGIAAALDLDVHAGPAAKDVRAAIEALS